MKRIIAVIIVVISAKFSSAQYVPSSPAEQLATKIAVRMRDSLSLTSVQKDSLFAINMRITSQKSQARQQHPGDSLTYYIQKIENTRDSLYHRIITDSTTYQLYKQKKRFLVNNN